MEEAILEAIKQVPALGVLCFLVVMGMKFLREERNTFTSIVADIHAKQEQLFTRAIELTNRCFEAINQNTNALGANTTTMARVEDTLCDFRDLLQRQQLPMAKKE